MQQQVTYYNPQDEIDEELTIDLKKILLTVWSRRKLLLRIFTITLGFFILLTFIMPKKYTVEADLYINKSNNTNMAEINPYFLDDLGAGGGMSALMPGGNNLANELELIQSPLVIDKVIRENNLIIKKKWGIIPNRKEGEYISTKAFLKKNISIENKKGTNVITIEYKSKKPDVAYNVTQSIINNYITLHKNILLGKSKSDLEVLEKEYEIAKMQLNEKINAYKGIPTNATSSSANLATMSAFSTAASRAMGTLRGNLISGQRSEIAIREETARLQGLANKITWAKLVDNMADSSKVLVLKEPQQLRNFEYSSPKLFINILLGVVFGLLASLAALVYLEITDKTLTYSMLGDNIIYNLKDNFSDLNLLLLANQNKNIAIASFLPLSENLLKYLAQYRNVNVINADVSVEFANNIKKADAAILFLSVGKTNSKLYKQVKTLLSQTNIQISGECII